MSLDSTVIVFLGRASCSRGGEKSFGETYTSDNGLVYAMNIKFTKANIDPNEFAVHSGNMTYNDGNKNYGCTGGYVSPNDFSPPLN